MKILVIIHEFPPIGGGGGPIARDLSGEWAASGHQVRVVSSHFGNLAKREIVDGVEIVRLPSHRTEMYRAKLPAMAGYIFAALRYCLFEMKDFRPDIIHVHFAVPNGPVAFLLSKFWKIPYVLTVHLGDIPDASPEKTGKWFKYIFPFTPPIWKKAARIIAVSQFSRQMALRKYSVPITVIPNGVNYQKIKVSSVQPHNIPEIVFAGRFVPQKNINQIVKTCVKIKDLSWHCTLIGDGQEKEKLLNLIASNELQDRFTITGWKTPEQVIEIFQKSDILFLPSRSEGLPVVGIQAMACGLALVLSTAGGNPEIILAGRNGFVEDPDDTDGFVRDFTELLTSSEKLLNFRKTSLEEAKAFDIKIISKDYERVFTDVVQNKNCQ